MPRDGTPSLDAFLDGDGSAAAREKLVHDTWWQDRYQDGRRSVAMLDLLESIRALRASGAKIDVLRFDIDQGAKTSPGERDERMASTLLVARKAQPDAVFVVFAGNLHVARKGFPFQPGFTWMAMHLARAGVRFVSLNARYLEGSAWGCSGSTPEGCGPRYLDSMHTSAAGIHLEPSADGNYDGWFGVGAATASPPAGLPALAAGLAEKLAHLRETPSAYRAASRRAYNAKDFAGCVAALGRIAEHTGVDAYNQACCHALAGQKDLAFERLSFAVTHGVEDRASFAADADLASLHDDPRWSALISKSAPQVNGGGTKK